MNKRKNKTQKVQIGLALSALLLGGGIVLQDTLLKPVYAVNEADSADSIGLISTASTSWKYLDDNTDPAAGLPTLQDWTKSSFNDASWKTEKGAFGSKKGELVDFDGFSPTVHLKQYYEAKKNTPTFFFRTKVTISDIDEITSIKGAFYHDDAAAVYVNGKLLTAIDMPTETQTSNMYYAGVSAGAPKKGEINLAFEKVKDYFVEGENTIAVELHNDRETSSDLYFEFRELKAYKNEAKEEAIQKAVTLSVGENQTSKNISWFANVNAAGAVQYTKKANVVNGVFPSEYKDVKANVSEANEATFYVNHATLSGLDANSQYAYRVVNGDAVSSIYYFETKNQDGAFNFVLVGDPQIGSGGTAKDTTNWAQTLETATTTFNPDFIVSAGDQVNVASSESEYTGYLAKQFASYAQATSIGNHDSGSKAYGQHFNLPNESSEYGVSTAGGDYWYVYNNTLFMNINSNDRSNSEHKAFMEEAIKQNPNVRWKTVVFHHSIYSTASHVNDGDIIDRRAELPPIFDELDIDVVLMGHDHVYTRTYMMDGFTPDTSKGVQSKVVDPTGILYLTANSASGSKYYDIKAPTAEYAAKQDQSYKKTFTNIEVSDTTYKMTTYFSDTMEVLDTFTIEKSVEVDASTLEESLNTILKKVDTLDAKLYTETSWNTLEEAITEAQAIVDSVKNESKVKATTYTQAEIDAAQQNLEKAFNGLVLKVTPPANDAQKPSNNTTDKNAPSTGDTTNELAWLLLLAGAAGSAAVIRKKKVS